MPDGEVKEVIMDAPVLEGGGTRKRRGGRRRKTQKGGMAPIEAAPEPSTVVEKAGSSAPVLAVPPQVQVGGSASGASSGPKVVLAPPKKKQPKVMLVAKSAIKKPVVAKTFKAKRVRVTIDNTAKTHKRRRQLVQDVEGLSEAKLREAAVAAKLARPETVAKVPVTLLRQMLKDYRLLRGQLV